MHHDASVLHGVVRGNTIQLEREPGLPEGQQVEVTIRAVELPEIEPIDRLKRAFGAWADEADAVDDFLSWNRQQRKSGRAEIAS